MKVDLVRTRIAHDEENDIEPPSGLEPSAALRREHAERDLVLWRWVLLATATLYLLFSGDIQHPVPGWIAIALGSAANTYLSTLRQQRSIPLLVSVATQLVDIAVLLLYTAARTGGLSHHLPLYTTMLILSTIRFGGWGAGASGLLGLGLTLATALLPGAYAGPTPAVIAGTIIADAILLGYFAHLSLRQYRLHQEQESQLHKRISEITVLHEVSSRAHDLKSEDALQNVVEIVTKLMGFQRAALFLTSNVGEMIPHRYYSYRSAMRHADLSPLTITPRLFDAILEQRRPVIIDGSQGSPDMESAPALHIAVPLHSDGRPIGVLVADSNDRRSTSRTDMKMLDSLAKSAIVAIDNATLHRRVSRMANHDGVTDLYNHRYFQERLREMLRAAEGQWPVSLLMVEIDKFKRYNDTFGHRQGDTALYSLSRALEQSTTSLDGFVARYGGDEFVVILPRIERDDALAETRHIRDQTYEIVTALLAEQNLPPVMLSIGVATYPDDAQNAFDLVEAADQAMYVVKHSGGNRVHAFSESGKTL